MKTLASETFRTPAGRAVLIAQQRPGDPMVSIYARLWRPGDGIDDAPEVRCRCKADQYPTMWSIAMAQIHILLSGG